MRPSHIPCLCAVIGVFALCGSSADARKRANFERELDTIPVSGLFGPVDNAWRGGWERARPQLIDADADGDLDLFVTEDTGMLRYFRNDGGTGPADFVFQTDDYAGVHDLYFTRVADVDSDGDIDLLVEAPTFLFPLEGGGMVERTGGYLYTNIGSAASPSFENVSVHPDAFFTDELGDPIPFQTTSPDFVDIDDDGDADLFLGDTSGSVILYRNVGGPGNPIFRFETSTYRDLEIRFGSCGGEEAQPGGLDLRHGFMLFTFFDFTGDDLPDLFVGDQFNSNTYYYRNLGGSPSPDFGCQTQSFYPDPTGQGFSQYLVSTFGDVDGDGIPEALMGAGTAATNDGLHLFDVNGGGLGFVTNDYLPELDLGNESCPALADLDGDGDLDMVIGVGSTQQIAFCENVGSATDPAFAVIQEDWILVPGASWIAPEIADIDDDGDLDLFAGMADGAVRFWRNDGAASWPPQYTQIIRDDDFGPNAPGHNPTFRANVQSNGVPRFFDADGDGDLDVLMGNWNFSNAATLQYFRNDGNGQVYSYAYVTHDYQGLGPLGQGLAPCFVDLDEDGDDDLLVGNFDGNVGYLDNVGSKSAPSYRLEDKTFEGIDVGVWAVPFPVDLDDDGDCDLIVGERGGGLNLYRNRPTRVPAKFSNAPDRHPETHGAPGEGVARGADPTGILNAFPTPSRDWTEVSYSLPAAGPVRVAVYDARGRLVRALRAGRVDAGRHSDRWDGRSDAGQPVASGVYFVRFDFEGFSDTRRIIRLR